MPNTINAALAYFLAPLVFAGALGFRLAVSVAVILFVVAFMVASACFRALTLKTLRIS